MKTFVTRTDLFFGSLAITSVLHMGAISLAQDTGDPPPAVPQTQSEAPVEPVEPVEPIKTKPAKSAKPIEPAESAESATPAESSESSASADAASLRFRLDEVVVTATRTGRRAFDTPYITDTVGSLRLREQAYRSSPEALRDIPGVMVQKTSHGQGSPYLRGFTGFRTVQLIDGIRLNNSVFRDGPNQYFNTIDPLSIDHFEVVKGPSSVLYGSDAIGGTIAAFTKNPTTYGEGFNTGGKIIHRYSSAERSNIGRGEISFSQNDTVGAIVGVTIKHFGDLEAGSPTNLQPNTGYSEYSFDAKAEVWISDTARLVFAHQTVRQNNVPRTHRTIFSKSFKGTTLGSDLQRDLDQERHLSYLQLHADEMDGLVDSMTLSLSWQRQIETRDRIKGSGARDLQGFDVGTLGLWARFTSDTAVGELTYGVSWYRDFVNSFSSKNTIQGPVADNATYDLVGVYLQDEYELTQRASFIVGGRFNYARINAKSVQDPLTSNQIAIKDNFSSLVGSARLTYSLLPDHLTIFGGVSQGFRAPNLSDLTRLDSARTNEIETPSPGLDSERFLSYEIGVKTKGDWWAAQASYFYTNINGLIVSTPTGNVIDGENEITKRNSGDGFVQGLELGASLRLRPQWTLSGHVAWVEGRVDTFATATSAPAPEPLSRLMPINGQIGLRYTHPNSRFWIEGALTLSDKADRLSSRDIADTGRIPPGGTPAFEVFSIRSGWRIRDNLNLTLALENLTDANYRIHGSGQNEPGRSIVVGIELTF